MLCLLEKEQLNVLPVNSCIVLVLAGNQVILFVSASQQLGSECPPGATCRSLRIHCILLSRFVFRHQTIIPNNNLLFSNTYICDTIANRRVKSVCQVYSHICGRRLYDFSVLAQKYVSLRAIKKNYHLIQLCFNHCEPLFLFDFPTSLLKSCRPCFRHHFSRRADLFPTSLLKSCRPCLE